MRINKASKGFTLIELLVVIGIIAVLAAVVLIAINPARQFAQARNSQRTSNVNAILNAIGQYSVDNNGDMPAEVPAVAATPTTEDISDTVGESDLCDDLVPTYLPALPTDPDSAHDGVGIDDCSVAYDTGYTITRETSGRVTISAPSTEIPPATVVIEITR